MEKPIILIASTLIFAIFGLVVAYFESTQFGTMSFIGGLAGFFVGGVSMFLYKAKSS